MLEIIQEAWEWCSGSPTELVDSNAFGNVIFRTEDGRYWRICPEELSCEVIADTPKDFEALRTDPEFLQDWRMENLFRVAQAALGPLPESRCYCLKMPAVLGGAYAEENLGTISRAELIGFAGHLARQSRDLPDGSKIRIVFTD